MMSIFWSFSYALLTIFCFWCVERIWPVERNQPTRKLILNLVYTGFGVFILSIFNTYALTDLIAAIYQSRLFPLVRLPASDSIYVEAAKWVGFFVLEDALSYWNHRALHSIPWLWSIHQLHHSDDSLNASTTGRVHWIQVLFAGPLMVIPLAALVEFNFHYGIGALATVSYIWVYATHANIRVPFGRLSLFVCGPQVHRIHHSLEERHLNKNFATHLPVWDLAFGTYYHPAPGEFPATGLAESRSPSLSEALTYPIREPISLMRNAYRSILDSRKIRDGVE